MSGSDPYDDFGDDDLFNDPETLAHVAKVEAEAVQASQAPKKTVKPYHHVVARPKSSQARNQPFKPPLLRKDPGPVNTEPRASTGGFGWEHGGKRQQDTERYVAQVEERQAYWNTGMGRNEAQEDADDEPPEVILTNEQYDVAPVEIVDTHARATAGGLAKERLEKQIQDQEERKAQAAAARRAAIESQAPAHNNGGPGPSTARHMTKTTSVPLQQPQPHRFSSAHRSFSRSISAGGNPAPRPMSRGPQLSPIPSQTSSQTPPASQGSMVRKAAFELEEERRKREALETEVEKLKADLAEQKRQAKQQQLSAATSQIVPHGDDAKSGGVEDAEAIRNRLDAMQTDLYRAKGEAEQIRRAQKEETARHLAEADRLRARIGDMENKMREREKDAARQVENVKTQAVFANHSAHNSAIKARMGSQRPAATPIRQGSPRGKATEESFLQRTAGKGKGKAPPPPAPQFGALNNAFATSPRIKKTRLDSELPTADFSPTKVSPRASPARTTSMGIDEDLPASPLQGYGELGNVIMENIVPLFPPGNTQSGRMDDKAELLHLLFNHIPPSPFQASYDPSVLARPALYRVLRYQPPPGFDPEGEYGKNCSALLTACGDMIASLDHILQSIARALCACLLVVVQDVETPAMIDLHLAEVSTAINLLSLLGRIAWLFDSFPSLLIAEVSNFSAMLHSLVNALFSNKDAIAMLDRRMEEDIAALRRSEHPVEANEAAKNSQTQIAYQWAELTQLSSSQEALKRPASPPPVDPTVKLWSYELACAIADLVNAMSWHAGGPGFWRDDELVDIAVGLTSSWLGTPTVLRCANVFWHSAICNSTFRSTIAQSARWPGQDPALDRMSRLVLEPPKDASEEEVCDLMMTMVSAWSAMSVAEPDAIVLIAQRSSVVPALTSILRRVTMRLWGVWLEDYDLNKYLELVQATVSLFHHFIKPHYTKSALKMLHDGQTGSSASQSLPPTQSDEDDHLQGINLLSVFKDGRLSRAHRGWERLFVSAMGALSWASPSVDLDGIEFDLAHIQDMAQEVIDVLMEGPEGDEVYEVFVDEDEDEVEEDVADVDEEALQQAMIVDGEDE